jgi:hypothetical protein
LRFIEERRVLSNAYDDTLEVISGNIDLINDTLRALDETALEAGSWKKGRG